MRTLGRILIILFVFALVMGMTYTIVNASSSNSPINGPSFERGEGERPEFPGGGRPDEFRGDGEGHGFDFGLGMILGAIKNTGIVGVIVALIVIPKNRREKKKRSTAEAA